MNEKDPFPDAAPMDTVPSTSSPGYAKAHPVTRAFDAFASAVTRWAGSPVAFGLHLKLNELLASNKRASNQLIGIEDATEDELRKLAAAYLQLAEERNRDGTQPLCVDGAAAEIARRLANAQARHTAKQGGGERVGAK